MSTKINPELVLSTLLTFYNDDGDEFKSLMPFCQAAANQISGFLKNDEYAAESSVLYAAACAAYEKICYHKCLSGNGISTLSVGDISASADSEALLKTSHQLTTSAIAAASDYLESNSFFFMAY